MAVTLLDAELSDFQVGGLEFKSCAQLKIYSAIICLHYSYSDKLITTNTHIHTYIASGRNPIQLFRYVGLLIAGE